MSDGYEVRDLSSEVPIDLTRVAKTEEEGFHPKDLSEAINTRIVREMELDDRVLDDDIQLWDRILIHMDKRIIYSEILCPTIMASLGAHIADIHQANPDDIPGGHDTPFYYTRGIPDVVNLPVTIVSPAGFSKSYLLKNFFKKGIGICPIRSKFAAKITEAGYVAMAGPEGEPLMGDAYHYRDGYLLFNEISNLFITSGTSHSGELVNQVMESLSERYVTKRTGNMNVGYPTCVSIIGGVQPMRFNTAQGVGRRFEYITKIWGLEDIEMMKIERKKEKVQQKEHRSINMREVNKLREDIKQIFLHCSVETYQWDEKMYDYITDMAKSHLDQEMMERILLGKEILNNGTETKIHIKFSKANVTLINMSAEMRQIVSMGGDVSYMVGILARGKQTTKQLWRAFEAFGYQYTHFNEVLKVCRAMKLIDCKLDPLTGGNVYFKNEERGTIIQDLEDDTVRLG